MRVGSHDAQALGCKDRCRGGPMGIVSVEEDGKVKSLQGTESLMRGCFGRKVPAVSDA